MADENYFEIVLNESHWGLTADVELFGNSVRSTS